jgi:23S rRNA pseudouridine1911/1915/1917 synthase
MLHAAELGFAHPHDGRSMRFIEPVPEDMAQVVAELERKDRGQPSKR